MNEGMVRAASAKPPLLLSTEDHDRLCRLAEASLIRYPSDDALLLLDELLRADTLPADWMPPRVVAMNSYVEYRDERNKTVRRVQLVYPHQANVSRGRVSVVSLIGAALIGLGEGQSISCRTRDRGERRFSVLRVRAEPFAEDCRASTSERKSKRRRGSNKSVGAASS